MRFLFYVLMAAAWRLRRSAAFAGVLVVGVHPACGGDALLHLENARIAVAIDPQSGAVHSIRAKQLDVAYPQTGIGFEIETAAGILDRLKEAGVHDVMTAHTWYGRGNHPRSPPYIDRMRIEPMGFPKG